MLSAFRWRARKYLMCLLLIFTTEHFQVSIVLKFALCSFFCSLIFELPLMVLLFLSNYQTASAGPTGTLTFVVLCISFCCFGKNYGTSLVGGGPVIVLTDAALCPHWILFVF